MPDHGDSFQSEAIRHGDGPALVLAGPGSGKTTVITRRIRYLIDEKKVEPDRILVITFTKAAAKEMRSRFQTLMKGRSCAVNFGTFHAVYYHILQSTYHYHSGNIISNQEKRQYLKTALLQLKGQGDFLPHLGKEEEEELLLAEISTFKCCGAVHSSVLEQSDFEKLYKTYNSLMKDQRKLDFEDMVLQCYDLFLKKPEILHGWQEKFQYILVDEFQDINPMQYQVICLLAAPQNNLFVVGDDDQAIYGFRGASPKIMLDFPKDYQDTKTIYLKTNYRSLPIITENAEKLIGCNKERFEKQVDSFREERKDALKVYAFTDQQEENRVLSQKIKEALDGGRTAAVLYRTNRECAAISEELTRQKIPFIMKEAVKSFYEQPVCKDLLAYLSFAKEERSLDNFMRIMNKPVRYISRSAFGNGSSPIVVLSELKSFYQDRKDMQDMLDRLWKDFSRMISLDLYGAVGYVRKVMGYDQWLRTEAAQKGINSKEMLAQADTFQEKCRSFKSIFELKEHIALYEKQLQKSREKQSDKDKVSENAVQLMTYHGAKGLEFSLVMLPDLIEGAVPHTKSMKGRELEEERRMFYVAMTRAKDELILSYVTGEKKEETPSRFLFDCGLMEKEASVAH